MTLLNQLTLEELQTMIDQAVERKLRERLDVKDSRPVEEILDSIERNRWTPPPAAPSNLELLRPR